ncbi:prolyl oligopeptidase family serine peptidase [Caulobacter segnis]|uniref:alpha/beta hydrolase family protein n=1 Tax=Caulobacter segnis TaxID=88688 RepID=UPI0024103084|nr:prolyl oligopeptidase family serine peptidase [Caulobacter segnis]MDG2520528.1 prolyl oligopeptidase family serine peptidase [Caulobacter segnis]
MRSAFRKAAAAAGALFCAFIHQPVVAAPLTPRDLVALEEFVQAGFEPSGRYLFIEHRLGRDQAQRFDYGRGQARTTGRISVADLKSGGAIKPLFAQSRPYGYSLGPVSPSGARLAVYRFNNGAMQVGVVNLADRTVRWAAVRAVVGLSPRNMQWRSDDELLVVAEQRSDFDRDLDRHNIAATKASDLQRRAALGLASMTVVDSRDEGCECGFAPGRIVSVNARDGAVRTLASGRFYDLELSPDGAVLAAAYIAGAASLKNSRDMVGETGIRRNLMLIDLKSGAAQTPCADCDISNKLISWSPSGDQLMFHARPAGGAWGQVRIWSRSQERLRVIDDIDAQRVITTDQNIAVAAQWRGETPYVFGSGQGGAPAWRRGAPGAGPALYPGGADAPWRLDASGPVEVSETAHRLAARARLLQLGAPRRRFGATPPGGTVSAQGTFDYAPQPEGRLVAAAGGQVVTLMHDRHGVAALVLSGPGKAARTLSVYNPWLADREVPSAVELRHRTAGGDELVSLLYRPARPRPGGDPLIVMPYPGADRVAVYRPDQMRWSIDVAVMTGQGYAVLTPAMPAREGEPGLRLADQVLPLVDRVIKEGYADPDRLALWGNSFGGFGALAIATQTDRFKAVVAAHGLYDLTAVWSQQHPALKQSDDLNYGVAFAAYWAEGGQGDLKGPPWAQKDRYVRNSPLYFADKVSAPVLLLHSDLDHVAEDQAIALYAALRRQGKDVRLARFWGEGHVIESPANLEVMFKEAFAFLERSLHLETRADQ